MQNPRPKVIDISDSFKGGISQTLSDSPKSPTLHPDTSLIDNKGNKNQEKKEQPSMSKKNYVTHEELDHAINRISDKMDNMEARLDTKFEQVNTKFEQINTKFAEQENKQIKWFIATAIAIVGLTVSLIKIL